MIPSHGIVRASHRRFIASSIDDALQGVTDGSNADPGYVGEYLYAERPANDQFTMPNGAPTMLVPLDLSAGDWDLSGLVCFSGTSGTVGLLAGWIGTGPGIVPVAPNGGGYSVLQLTGIPGGGFSAASTVTVGRMRLNTEAPISVYLSALASWAVGNVLGFGCISARRMR